MASAKISLLCFTLACILLERSHGARQLTALLEEQPLLFALSLTNQNNNAQARLGINIKLICYGKFTAPQRAIMTDFVASLSSSTEKAGGEQKQPSVASWWMATEKSFAQSKAKMLPLTLGDPILDDSYSLGKSLTDEDIAKLAATGDQRYAINVVLTSDDVAVEGFCKSRCGAHGFSPLSKSARYAYIWVGNSATQCPGQCALPFHQPVDGPMAAALVAPNGDVGVDGMVFHLASMMSATFKNPFGKGLSKEPGEPPLDAALACPGPYAKGACPGYAGDLLLDPSTGASYNVNGANGRKFLVPALFDP